MALDKQFLKYKLEKIKNDRIWKDQDAETKRRVRKDNAKLAQEEADAIHSYLTGEDPIDAFDNKSFFENPLPGGLFITNKGQLNVAQVDKAGTKKSRLMSMLRKHKSLGGANQDSRKKLRILKKIFDGLNIIFKRNRISIKGDLEIEGDLFFRGEKPNENTVPNGYVRLPGNMMIQWGIDTSDADGDHIISFPISFPNNCFSVVVNHQLSGGWNTGGRYGYPITAHSYTKTGFTINRNNDASETINLNYIAIGF